MTLLASLNSWENPEMYLHRLGGKKVEIFKKQLAGMRKYNKRAT